MREAISRLLTALAFGATLSSTMAFGQTAMFSVKALPIPPGYTQAVASSINNAGDVVGSVSALTNFEPFYAVIWSNGTPTFLGAVPLSSEGTSPSSLNSAGQVVGTVSASPTAAVIWNNGTPTVLADTNSTAVYINDAGQVVGNATPDYATVWNGSTPTTLDLLPGCTYSTAKGINSGGLIVGYMTGGCNEAVVWHGTTPAALPKFAVPRAGAEALAVNNSGIVVGKASSPTSGTAEEAAAWANGVVTDLGTLKGNSVATAINNRGVIVGVSDTNTASANHAVLWSRIGAPTQDLNNLISATAASEVFLQGASAINDNCTIVVQGFARKTKRYEALLLILNDPSQCVNGL